MKSLSTMTNHEVIEELESYGWFIDDEGRVRPPASSGTTHRFWNIDDALRVAREES